MILRPKGEKKNVAAMAILMIYGDDEYDDRNVVADYLSILDIEETDVYVSHLDGVSGEVLWNGDMTSRDTCLISKYPLIQTRGNMKYSQAMYVYLLIDHPPLSNTNLPSESRNLEVL